MKHNNHIVYIVYGDNDMYYTGAIISFLSFFANVSLEQRPNVIILTEKPDFFSAYPVTCLPLEETMLNEWSMNGEYHFRIKNRGLRYLLSRDEINDDDKVLFLDTDTYFTESPMPLFDMINEHNVLLFLNEGKISDHRSFQCYQTALQDTSIALADFKYQLSSDSEMWGSLMMGVLPRMITDIDCADELMQKLMPLVDAHTIEQFSFVEIMKRHYSVHEGKQYVQHYSRHKQKVYAEQRIKNFMNHVTDMPFEQKIQEVSQLRLTRPWYVVVLQKIGLMV